MTFKDKWDNYRKTRKGDYAFRSRTRYNGVFGTLQNMGLEDGHGILDLGAGDCHFGQYCFQRGWRGSYTPVDATIGGHDLEYWAANGRWKWVVAIEVAEHLVDPLRFIREATKAARLGIVITTPNPRVVDVLKCDPTHVSVITTEQLHALHFAVTEQSYFSEQHKPGQLDTLLAYRKLSCK